MKLSSLFTSLIAILLIGTSCQNEAYELPNILWITSEDNSPLLGCYGDEFATTPNLDQLAGEGFLYTNAYANAPVCAPARNTIISGVYACANGNEQMRSYYPTSERVHFYPEYLRELGYYCTNNSKTDYNTVSAIPDSIWDESSRKAHYKNRAENQPFFAIFNTTISHESCLHKSTPDSLLRHSPEDVSLPPYHPDTPELRHDWAQYYDKVEDMDTRVGELLAELEEAGLAENTIVLYYADHGGVVGRSKRYLYESGTHVPMIARIPEKYKKLWPAAARGESVDRMVSFVDLAPTLLSLAGEKAPGFMQGSAFLGIHPGEAPEYVYMFRDRMDGRYDMVRSIVDKQYRYIRNYNPERPWMQHLEYLWRAPSMPSWEEEFKAGRCNEVQARFWGPKPVEELYDKEKDPWQVHNLAEDPDYAERLTRMRKACVEKGLSIRDAGFIPEVDRMQRTRETTAYDYVRSEGVPYAEIVQAANAATSGKGHISTEELLGMLKNEDAAIRYWAAAGLLQQGTYSDDFLADIEKASFDPSWNVSVTCAEMLYRMGETKKSIAAFLRVFECELTMARTLALNSIDLMGGTYGEFGELVASVPANYEKPDNQYDVRVAMWLMEKWGIK